MKLDRRIKKLSDILTRTNIEEARKFINQPGYFTDYLELFDDLEDKRYGTLAEVSDCYRPFRTVGGVWEWKYFIPESKLKPTEKNYRPFRTLQELRKYDIVPGKTITFRNDKYPEIAISALVTEINYNPENNELIDITLGATGYEFDTLWECYSILKNDINWWVPFGVNE